MRKKISITAPFMKGLYIFITSLISATLMSCASDIAGIDNGDDGYISIGNEKGVFGIVPEIEWANGTEITRSTLTFDYNKKIMKFSWVNSDQIGVFPVDNETGKISQHSQQTYSISQIIDGLKAKFSTEQSVKVIGKGEKYISYSPINSGHDGNNIVKVTYNGQVQSETPNMNAYFKKTDTDMLNAYLTSEALSSNHLGAYDYLVSTATSPEDEQLSFQYTRLGSVVRFYLKVPEPVFYDSLQVINKDAEFILDADMDITKTVSSEAFSATKTSHIVSLKFRDGGFDLTNPDDDTKPTYNYYRQDVTPKVGYVVAYMMFAPINLNQTKFEKSTLYLIGHKIDGKNEDGTDKIVKTYYRAKDKMTKINIAQNKLQQWAPTIETDIPIEFEPVTIEVWQQDTSFNNEGHGTEGW